jgi:excisionase family DNA binding protein
MARSVRSIDLVDHVDKGVLDGAAQEARDLVLSMASVTVRSAAKIAAVSEQTIRRAVDDGALPHQRLGDRITIRLAHLKAWLDNRLYGAH